MMTATNASTGNFTYQTVSSVTHAMFVRNFYAISVLNSISNVIAFVIGIIALIGILKAQNFSAATRVFLANMTIIDLISAISLQPCTTAYLILWIKGTSFNTVKILSDVTNYLHYIVSICSFFAFMAVSVDRYMLLYQPLTYANILNTRIAIGISTALNVTVIISFTILQFNTTAREPAKYCSIIMYISIALLLCIHTRIMITAMRTYRKIRLSAVGGKIPQTRLRRRRVEIKQASVTVGLFLTITICYLPIIIINQISFFEALDKLQLSIIGHWALFLMMACPIGKQFLLCVMNKAIRAAVKRWVFLLREPEFV